MVHPHARGEDGKAEWSGNQLIGSPPRTWGRRYYTFFRDRRGWFTPTHVGKTSAGCRGVNADMVHPHARGEDTTAAVIAASIYGSPPRTWGRLSSLLLCVVIFWFTPTHVGKTLRRSDRPNCYLVHPHARGEDRLRFRTGTINHGSPPRTWGRPHLRSLISG